MLVASLSSWHQGDSGLLQNSYGHTTQQENTVYSSDHRPLQAHIAYYLHKIQRIGLAQNSQTKIGWPRTVSERIEVSRAVSDAEIRLTALLLRRGSPLIGVTSEPVFEVSFCVFLLYPVNCRVAPRIESIKEPIRPPNKPAKTALLFTCKHRAEAVDQSGVQIRRESISLSVVPCYEACVS